MVVSGLVLVGGLVLFLSFPPLLGFRFPLRFLRFQCFGGCLLPLFSNDLPLLASLVVLGFHSLCLMSENFIKDRIPTLKHIKTPFKIASVCPVLPVVVIGWHCGGDSSRLLVFGAFGGVFRLKPA